MFPPAGFPPSRPRTNCCALRILTPGILYPLCRLRPRTDSSAGLVIRDLMLEDDLTQTEVMILDEDLRVLDGTSLIPGKTDYTQRELELLTNRWSSQYTLYRKSAQDSSAPR